MSTSSLQDGEAVGVELREVEHVADEALEPLAPRLRRSRATLLRRSGSVDRPLAQRRDVAADRGQRRPQLVRDGHQEVPLQLLRLGEPGRHLAEAARPGGRSRPPPGLAAPARRSGPRATSSAASESASTGRVIRRERYQRERARDERGRRANAIASRSISVSHVVRSSAFGFATTIAPKTGRRSPSTGAAAASNVRSCRAALNSNVSDPRRSSRPTSTSSSGSVRRPASWPGKSGLAPDVVERGRRSPLELVAANAGAALPRRTSRRPLDVELRRARCASRRSSAASWSRV